MFVYFRADVPIYVSATKSDARFRNVNNSENTPTLRSVSNVTNSVPKSSVFRSGLRDVTILGDNRRNNIRLTGSSSSSLPPKSS